MVTIKIIIGSTRPSRFGHQPAHWLASLTDQYKDKATFEIVDLADVNLPMLDEPLPAGYDQYSKDHTKAWAKVIAEADGFVFVTSEYNHSYAPALKNAIDFVYKEWNNKPVSFLAYGADAGGARAVEHLRGVAAWLKLYDLSEHVLMPSYSGNLDDDRNYQFTDSQVKKAHAMLTQLVFWSEQMQRARKELADQQ